MKRHVLIPLALAVLGVWVARADAAEHRLYFAGNITSIIDHNAQPGAAFTIAQNQGVQPGAPFFAGLVWDSTNLESTEPFSPNAAGYDYRPASPQLDINHTAFTLSEKLGLTVFNDVMASDPVFDAFSYFRYGIEQAGPYLETPIDMIFYFGDVTPFDAQAQTGTEFILVSFDPNASILSNTDAPASPPIMQHAFLVLLETVNGQTTAAAIGSVTAYGSSRAPGDTDFDNDIDDTDLGTAFSNYTGPTGAGKAFTQGDTDNDGDVDDTDLGTLFSSYTGPLAPARTGVPEPASVAMLGVGAFALSRRRR
ncbi:MAG: PEP-CTERM sorting domain-containing protein [Phycisphaeraceae bacterium]